MTHKDVLEINGWTLYAHPAFLERLEALLTEVEEIAAKDPGTLASHPTAKLLLRVKDCIYRDIPADPTASRFNLGKTLGPKNKHWKRAKNGLPPRYRLFFQYRSTAPKAIIFAWLNDECTLRKEGSKSDVYTVFESVLKAGTVPTSYDDLLKKCASLPKSA